MYNCYKIVYQIVLCEQVFNKEVSFLVDMGVAVSLAFSEALDCIKPSIAPRMNLRLVSVDGGSLQIQGSVIVEFSGKTFVNALTSEGILGLNFLEANSCVLDLG